MAIFPPQVPQAELERLSLLKAELGRGGGAVTPPACLADKKAPVPRPPLAQALSEELRRFAKDEGGFSFIDWAITVSVVSMGLGFFIPDLWALFGEVIASVTNGVDGVVFQVKHLR